jgi:hypothetical protein
MTLKHRRGGPMQQGVAEDQILQAIAVTPTNYTGYRITRPHAGI